MSRTRVIVAGTRDLPLDDVRKALAAGFARQGLIHEEVEAVATGEFGVVDQRGRMWAEYYNVQYVPFPADWDRLGKRAGPVRNEQMAQWASQGSGRGTLVAVWDGKSRGTADMILNAHRYGLEVEVQLVSDTCSYK